MTEKALPKILLINGPNLNMLGKRSKEHYGSFTLAQVESAFRTKAESLGVEPVFFQSNGEGEIVTAIQESMKYAKGIVINAGAYTHYSYAIFDALLLCGLPIMEVHISNIHKREPFRNVSVINAACVGQIYGLGLESYLVGLEKLVKEHIFVKEAVSPSSTVPDAETKAKLSELRAQISEVDIELMKVFNRRMDLAESIAMAKMNTRTAVYDARREAEVSDLAKQHAGVEMASRVDSLMKTMMRISREKQYDILMRGDTNWALGKQLATAGKSLDFVSRCAYGGTVGSYSEQAAQRLFPNTEKFPAYSFAEACDMVLSGRCDVAVLPVENTTAGSVDNVYELLQKKSLYIVRTTAIDVVHKLAVLPGTKLSDIKRVASHAQGLQQCSEMIHRSSWETVATENTAFAPEKVASGSDPYLAAICSEEAANRNGLEILPVEIRNVTTNQTRFVAVTKDLIITPDADRISTLMHLPHRSGALVSALEVFADRGLNLSSILSRPIQNTPGEYAFFLDFLCPAMGQEALLSLYQLSSEMPYVKVLGWYAED
jgi:chorismate mutase/prephenate dehydratase